MGVIARLSRSLFVWQAVAHKVLPRGLEFHDLELDRPKHLVAIGDIGGTLKTF